MPKPISPAEASAPRVVIVTMDHEMRDPMGHMNPTALTRNADGLIEATDEYIVFVAVWVNPGATDETAIRKANRESIRKAIEMAVKGRDPEAAKRLVERRDELTSPFYSGE